MTVIGVQMRAKNKIEMAYFRPRQLERWIVAIEPTEKRIGREKRIGEQARRLGAQ